MTQRQLKVEARCGGADSHTQNCAQELGDTAGFISFASFESPPAAMDLADFIE